MQQAAAGAGEGFEARLRGLFYSALSWRQLERLWSRVDRGAGWYLYCVGAPPPAAPAGAEEVALFIARIDELLRKEHRESYCGIVYADDLERPALIKIYDPNHLGSACGSSKNPPPPGWIMSLVPPSEIKGRPPAAARSRWWQGLFPRAG